MRIIISKKPLFFVFIPFDMMMTPRSSAAQQQQRHLMRMLCVNERLFCMGSLEWLLFLLSLLHLFDTHTAQVAFLRRSNPFHLLILIAC